MNNLRLRPLTISIQTLSFRSVKSSLHLSTIFSIPKITLPVRLKQPFLHGFFAVFPCQKRGCFHVDLEDAIALNSTTKFRKSHADVWVSIDLRARVALTMQDYPNAIKYAKMLIDGGKFPLMDATAYQSGFNNAPGMSEVMWAMMPILDQEIHSAPTLLKFLTMQTKVTSAVHQRVSILHFMPLFHLQI